MNTYAGLRPEDLEAALGTSTALADADVDEAIASAGDGQRPRRPRPPPAAARHSIAAYGRSAALRTVHQDLAIREAAGDAQVRFDAWQASVFARRDLFAALDAADDTSLSAASDATSTSGAPTAGSTARISTSGRARALKAAQARAAQLLDRDLRTLRGRGPGHGAHARRSSTGCRPAARDARTRRRTRDAAPARRVRDPRWRCITGVRRRDVRERYWWLLGERSATTNRGADGELFEVRRRIAQLAGFASWAELRTSTVVDADRGRGDGLARRARRPGPTDRRRRSWRRVPTAFGDRAGDAAFQPWDQFLAVAELGRGLGVDREGLRRFLPLPGVLDGLFRLSLERCSASGSRNAPEALGWHEDVRTLVLIDDATGEELGLCLFDPYARDGKDAEHGRVHGSPRGRCRRDRTASSHRCVTMLVTMFDKPGRGSPDPAVLNDVDGLFHEFGHVLDFTIGSRGSPVFDPAWWGHGLGGRPVPVHGLLGLYARRARDVCAGPRRRASRSPPRRCEALATLRRLDHLPYLERYLSLGRLDLAVHGPEAADLDERLVACWPPNPAAAGGPLPAVQHDHGRRGVRRRPVRRVVRDGRPGRDPGRLRPRGLAQR